MPLTVYVIHTIFKNPDLSWQVLLTSKSSPPILAYRFYEKSHLSSYFFNMPKLYQIIHMYCQWVFQSKVYGTYMGNALSSSTGHQAQISHTLMLELSRDAIHLPVLTPKMNYIYFIQAFRCGEVTAGGVVSGVRMILI